MIASAICSVKSWLQDSLVLFMESELSAPLLVIKAPDGIRPLRVAAGTSPVPLTAIAKQYIHAQHPLDADFSFVRPAGP